jgi:hypothetical protein
VSFVLDFGEDGPNSEAVTVGPRTFLQCQIGFDPDHGDVYFLTAALEYSITIDGHELSFWVTAVYQDGSQDDFWSGAETGFIPRFQRGFVRQALLLIVRTLIIAARPTRVTMVAIGEDLPERSIGKYLAINQIFNIEGYAVSEAVPIFGIRSWQMERP